MLSRTDLNRIAKTLGGIPVLGCIPGSPAALAGVRYGDVILSVNGARTSTIGEYFAATRGQPARMRMVVFRAGREVEIGVDLSAAGPVEESDLNEVFREISSHPHPSRPTTRLTH